MTGYCYDPSTPELCSTPPPGTAFPCLKTSDCPADPLGWPVYFCLTHNWGALGGCVPTPICDSGMLDPVCGCDGKSYVNAACAEAGGTSDDHAGQCADAGL